MNHRYEGFSQFWVGISGSETFCAGVDTPEIVATGALLTPGSGAVSPDGEYRSPSGKII
jgi:hypothetical protein